MERRRHAAQITARSAALRILTVFLLATLLVGLAGCSQSFDPSRLPQPVIPDYPELEALYWKSWQLLFEQQYSGTHENGFPALYLNSPPGEMLEQWPTITTALFGIYGADYLPVMQTLDIFYDKQLSNGFISRAYLTSTGKLFRPNTTREPMIHPPLFSWAELKYYELTGDRERLARVFSVLEKYYFWLDKNCRGMDVASDLYFHTELSSCMENAPRGNLGYGAWVDMSGQMAAFCRDLSRMAKFLKDERKSGYYQDKYRQLSDKIVIKLWNAKIESYADLTRDGELQDSELLAAYWPLFAGATNDAITDVMISRLQDSTAFYQPHLFPSVARSNPSYSANGFYWRGSVWSPLNYMIIATLKQFGQEDFAYEAVQNHLSFISKTCCGQDSLDASRLVAENKPEKQTLWECYSPENPLPATRWDDHYFVRSNAVEMTGTAAISMLIEDIIGLNINLAEGTIDWRLRKYSSLGIRNLKLGSHDLSLWSEPLPAQNALAVHGFCDLPLAIQFRRDQEQFEISTIPGPIEFVHMPENFILAGRTIE